MSNKLSKPEATAAGLRARIEAALDELRPALASHSGDVELVEIDGDVVRVAMSGACDGCAISHLTLKLGVERLIKERCPQIASVESVGGFVPGFDEPEWAHQRTDDGAERPVYTESPVVKLLDER